MPFMQPRQLPKGDITKLWGLLGVRFAADQVVWQDYNPYKEKIPFPEEIVFVDRSEGSKNPFNPDDPISAGLQLVLFPFPGSISTLNASDLDFTPLISTTKPSGTVAFSELMHSERGGTQHEVPTNSEYVLAARIRGTPKAFPVAAGKAQPARPATPAINVVLVADVDVLSPVIFQLRETNDIPGLGVHINLDNVSFVLNVLDSLAGDNHSFWAVRSHRPTFRTLTQIEKRTLDSTLKAAKQRDTFYNKCEELIKKEQEALEKKVEEISKNVEDNTTKAARESASPSKKPNTRWTPTPKNTTGNATKRSKKRCATTAARSARWRTRSNGWPSCCPSSRR